MANTNMPDDVQELGHENTAHAMEGTDQADGQPAPSAPNVFPLFEIIDDFVAQHPVLQEVTTPRVTSVYLMSDGERSVDQNFRAMHWGIRSGTAGLLQQIDDLDPQDHAVLIIEDINAELYHMLCARYSSSLDAEFLAQHILRLADLNGTFDLDHDVGSAFSKLGSHVRATLSRTYSSRSGGQHLRGHHIGGTMEIQFGSHLQTWMIPKPEPGYRSETFQK
jgi:hypothetical protein